MFESRIEAAATQLSEWFNSVSGLLEDPLLHSTQDHQMVPIMMTNMLASARKQILKMSHPFGPSIYKDITLALFVIATKKERAKSKEGWEQAISNYQKLRDQVTVSRMLKGMVGEPSELFYKAFMESIEGFFQKSVMINLDHRPLELEMAWIWGTRFLVAAAVEFYTGNKGTVDNQMKGFDWIGLTVMNGLAKE